MPRSPRPLPVRRLASVLTRTVLGGIALSGIVLAAAAPVAAADLPFRQPPAAAFGEAYGGGADLGGGGFRVARIPVRPAPIRFDIYGYPLLPGAPNPLATGSGCPAALQPDYDRDGNFAGYAPLPMCR